MIAISQPSAGASGVRIDDLIALVQESDYQRVLKIVGVEKDKLLGTLNLDVRRNGLKSDLRQKLAELFTAEAQAADQELTESQANQAAVEVVLAQELAEADPDASRIVAETRRNQEKVMDGAVAHVEEVVRGVESKEQSHIRKQLETQNWEQN